jgi:hypothetical protein
MSRKNWASKQSDFQKQLRVLVDMDQVLCDFERSFLQKYQETYPDHPFIPLDDRQTFYVADQYEKLGDGIAVSMATLWVVKTMILPSTISPPHTYF